jgi:hypothetical protein
MQDNLASLPGTQLLPRWLDDDPIRCFDDTGVFFPLCVPVLLADGCPLKLHIHRRELSFDRFQHQPQSTLQP